MSIRQFIPGTLLPLDAKPACDGQWSIFDTLIDSAGGTSSWQWARRQAAVLCDTCPERAMCHKRALEVGETWVAPVAATIREKRKAEAKAAARHCACGALARPRKTTCAICRYKKGGEDAA